MKRTLPYAGMLALLSGLAGLESWAGTPLPAPFPEARYRQMSARSPFAIASAPAATAAPTPGFAAQLYVDGVSHIGTKDFVAIKSRDPDKPAVIFLEVGTTAPDGMKIDRVNWSNQMARSTVDVSRNGDKATLIFDEQQMQMAKNANAVTPNQPMNAIGLQRDPSIPEAHDPRTYVVH